MEERRSRTRRRHDKNRRVDVDLLILGGEFIIDMSAEFVEGKYGAKKRRKGRLERESTPVEIVFSEG